MSKSLESITDAVVIGRAGSGEGSVRVFLYTEAHGLVFALAKSAREERSKLRPHLQIGSYGTYTLVRGTHDWRVIGATDTMNIHFALAGKQTAQQAAGRVLSVLRQLIHGEDENVELFQALLKFLNTLPTLEDDDVRIAEYITMVHILTSLGYVSIESMPKKLDAVSLKAARLKEKQMIHTINEALLASDLS